MADRIVPAGLWPACLMVALIGSGGVPATGLSQTAAPAGPEPVPARPRLVVVIAVDQLRPDYLDRFRRWFGPGGFNRFLRQGARFTSARYSHAVTETCVGHAVMLTGSDPMVNGIVANEWYDPALGRGVYCAEDTAAPLVGAGGSLPPTAGRSPRLLIGATVGDLLKMESAGRSRVVTVSAKDRSAIMLGGKLADAAYWLRDTIFVTSSYYRPDLPGWVRAFNAARPVQRYLGTQWQRVLPAAAYATVGPDDQPGEGDEAGLGRTFPHPLKDLAAFEHAPFADEIVADFALRAVEAEGLGRDSVPDLLGISFSATDWVGHTFGPDSHEILDDVLRLDRVLARLFGELDRGIGPGRMLVVLTADHGVSPLPEVAAGVRRGAGPRRIGHAVMDSAVSRALTARFGVPPAPGWIAWNGAPMLFLSRAALAARKIPLDEAARVARDALQAVPGVTGAVTGAELARRRDAALGAGLAGGRDGDAAHSYYPGRSGDVYYFLEPYWLQTDASTGTGHGTGWRYDQQVPLVWFGPGVRPGTYRGPADVADLAPTLSEMLGLGAPGGAQGRVLEEMLR